MGVVHGLVVKSRYYAFDMNELCQKGIKGEKFSFAGGKVT
jgi:hypothetical protein